MKKMWTSIEFYQSFHISGFWPTNKSNLFLFPRFLDTDLSWQQLNASKKTRIYSLFVSFFFGAILFIDLQPPYPLKTVAVLYLKICKRDMKCIKNCYFGFLYFLFENLYVYIFLKIKVKSPSFMSPNYGTGIKRIRVVYDKNVADDNNNRVFKLYTE